MALYQPFRRSSISRTVSTSILCIATIYLLMIGCSTNLIVINAAYESPEKPKNVIFIIGDGMGLPHISAAIYEYNNSPFELFGTIGLQKTHSTSDLITDSAAAGTAMACGQKTYNNAIGLDNDSIPLNSMLYYAQKYAMKTGLITTSSIVHATPASFYAHQLSRAHRELIATDLPKSNIDFIVGGGVRYFSSNRYDGKSLYNQFRDKNYRISNFNDIGLRGISTNPSKKVFHLTADGEPFLQSVGQEYLSIAVNKGLDYFNSDPRQPFFMVVEAAQIDWAGHSMNERSLMIRMAYLTKLLNDILAFASANGETLVILTADHSTGELGLLPDSEVGDVKVEFHTNDHTGSFVPVFAYGPKSKEFGGLYENTEIFHKVMKIMGWKEELANDE